MIDISKGRYWDLPWSLVDGCTPCSPGCDHCWSAAMTHRFNFQWTDKGHFNGKTTIRPTRLDIPLKRKKPTAYAVWNDLFHENVPFGFKIKVYHVMRDGQHTFLILTKRPNQMLEFIKEYTRFGMPITPNIWHGLTVCNQQEADEKLPIFLQVQGKKFLSVEPMLGPINASLYYRPNQRFFDAITKVCSGILNEALPMVVYGKPDGIESVILGGETGPGARPMHPDCVRAVRDQCFAAGVPFFFKQWGEYIHDDQLNYMDDLARELDAASIQPDIDGFYKVGRKRAGRTLDGITHDDLPWANP